MAIDPRVSGILDRWQQCRARGESLSAEELCRDCPDLREQVAEQLTLLRRIEALQGTMTVGVPGSAAAIPASPAGYEILGVLGRGGMAVVYRARQLALGREVALKMMLSGSHASDEERARFLGEAAAVAAVRHPGIVQVFDYGTHAGNAYCALEVCEGGSLADLLRDGPLPAREAARLVEQVSEAVQAAHERGILHRDLKPGNVLLASRVAPKVADFGLAKRLEGGGTLTQTGAVLGTPSYMAPEQAQGRKELGPAVDVYGLGAILYECLTGRPPFQAASAWDVVVQVIADDPVSVRQLQPRVARDLETICHKCLRKESEGRYASAADLAADLRRWLADEPIAARPVGVGERLVKWVRRRPVVAGLAAATVTALVAGTVVSWLFLLEARHQAREASASAEAANEAREAAEDEKANTLAALHQVQCSLADGLLRPLGHQENEAAPLNDFELEALEELVSLPPPREEVRYQFLLRALRRPETARQLDRRLGPALRAAVGLDDDRRRRVLGHLDELVKDGHPVIRSVAARMVGVLVVTEKELARDAALVLLEEGDAGGAGRLELPLGRLVRAVDEAGAAAVAAAITAATKRTNDPAMLRVLAVSLRGLADRLPAGEREACAAGLARAIAIWSPAEWRRPNPNQEPRFVIEGQQLVDSPDLVPAFHEIADLLSPQACVEVNRVLGQYAGIMAGAVRSLGLMAMQARLLPRLPEAARAETKATLQRTADRELRAAIDNNLAGDHPLDALVENLSADQVRAVATHAASTAAKAPPRRLGAFIGLHLACSRRLDKKDAHAGAEALAAAVKDKVHASRGAEELAALLDQTHRLEKQLTPETVTALANVFAAVSAPKLEKPVPPRFSKEVDPVPALLGALLPWAPHLSEVAARILALYAQGAALKDPSPARFHQAVVLYARLAPRLPEAERKAGVDAVMAFLDRHLDEKAPQRAVPGVFEALAGGATALRPYLTPAQQQALVPKLRDGCAAVMPGATAGDPLLALTRGYVSLTAWRVEKVVTVTVKRQVTRDGKVQEETADEPQTVVENAYPDDLPDLLRARLTRRGVGSAEAWAALLPGASREDILDHLKHPGMMQPDVINLMLSRLDERPVPIRSIWDALRPLQKQFGPDELAQRPGASEARGERGGEALASALPQMIGD